MHHARLSPVAVVAPRRQSCQLFAERRDHAMVTHAAPVRLVHPVSTVVPACSRAPRRPMHPRSPPHAQPSPVASTTRPPRHRVGLRSSQALPPQLLHILPSFSARGGVAHSAARLRDQMPFAAPMMEKAAQYAGWSHLPSSAARSARMAERSPSAWLSVGSATRAL